MRKHRVFLIALAAILNLSGCDFIFEGIITDPPAPGVNSAPVADAGADQNVSPELLVQLDGSNSTDVDSDALTYRWLMNSKPVNSSAILSDINNVSPTFTADTAGAYVLDLIVNDGSLDSAIDTVIITAGGLPTIVAPDWTFTDGFESTADHTFWLGDGESVEYGVEDPTEPQNKVMKMIYTPDLLPSNDAWSEYDFRLGIDAVQIEMSWKQYIPASYHHIEKNHKVFALWSGEYGKIKANISVSSEAWGNDTEGGALPSVYTGVDGNNYGHNMNSVKTKIWADGEGQWTNMHVFLELAENNNGYGRMDIYRDGQLLTSTHSSTLNKSYSSAPDGIHLIPYSNRGNFIDQGTLLGWANGDEGVNGGFTTETVFLIDDFSIKARASHGDITNINTAPVADAGVDQNVPVGTVVLLNGHKSTDAELDPLTYLWRIDSAPDNSTAELSDEGLMNPTFEVDSAGEYILTLTVNDGRIDSQESSITVIASATNSAPVANAGVNRTAVIGFTVTLNANQSTDADQDTLTYLWSLTSVPPNSSAKLSSTTATDPSFEVDVVGDYVFQLIADDNKAKSAAVTVKITGVEASTGLTDVSRLYTITRDFNGTPGVKTSLEANGFNGAGGRSFYSSEQAYSGNTSGKMTVLTTDSESQQGSGGWGRWGGVINTPEKLYKGDEIFMRWRMYYPDGFNNYTEGAGGRVKFIRIRSNHSDDSNAGYIDLYWDNITSGSTFKFIKEKVDRWMNVGDAETYPHLYNQWITYNVHYILSDDAEEGRVRVWQNNDLLIDEAASTLKFYDDYISNPYLFTYWNGEVPQDQSCYVDDFKVTSDRLQTGIHNDSGLNWIGLD